MPVSHLAGIDWDGAEMEKGVLTVDLGGDIPRGWARRFQTILALLDHGGEGWGEIVLHKKRIKVADVREGSEGDLRHLLESVVLQVNSDLHSDVSEGGEASQARRDDPQAAADRRMTDRFRAFGESGNASEDT